MLSLQCIRQLLQNPGALVVIDIDHDFNCTAAVTAGIPLERLLLIRPPLPENSSAASARSRLLWALEQTARCPGVCAVLCRLDRASSTVLRRLQLAVEASGVTVFLLRPASCLALTSWADLRLQLDSALTPDQSALQLRIHVAHSRHAVEHNDVAHFEISHETSVVSEVS